MVVGLDEDSVRVDFVGLTGGGASNTVYFALGLDSTTSPSGIKQASGIAGFFYPHP
jgi:hypothetical protein